jgi:hypothetical protein
MSDAKLQPQSRFRNLGKHPFWVAFWPGLAAIVAGIVIGLPFALWLNSYTESIGQQAKQSEERQRLNDGLVAVRAAIDFNRTQLQQFAKNLESHVVPFDLGLDVSAWDVSKAEIVPHMRDPDLQRRLAYHFSGLAALTRLNGLYLDQTVGVPSALGGSDNTRATLRTSLLARTRQLIEEAQALAQEVEAARQRPSY